jgi:hypothetical protein
MRSRAHRMASARVAAVSAMISVSSVSRPAQARHDGEHRAALASEKSQQSLVLGVLRLVEGRLHPSCRSITPRGRVRGSEACCRGGQHGSRSGLADVEAGDRAADDHVLDLAGAQEDGEVFRRACQGPAPVFEITILTW